MLTTRWSKIGALAASLFVLWSVAGWTQDIRFTSETELSPGHAKLQATLQQLVKLAKNQQIGSARIAPVAELTRDKAPNLEGGSYPAFRMEGDRVQVVIETAPSADQPALKRAIEQSGGLVQVIEKASIQALLPVASLEAISTSSDVTFIRLPVRAITRQQQAPAFSSAQGAVVSEGVSAIGAPAWHQAEINGNGVKVGVIDQFGLYRGLIGTELPSADKVTIQSFASHGEIFDPAGPEEDQAHGTAVSEIIYDIAPGASHYLAYAETDVEFREAVDWLIDQKVDVINTSLGFDSACFRGGGIFEPYFAEARRSGITWATAAGNEADIHWEGTYTDSDEDGYYNYSASDNTNTVQAVLAPYTYPSGKQVATAEISGVFGWDAPCFGAPDDFEIVVMKEENGQLVPLAEGISDWYFENGRPIKFFLAYEDFDASQVGETLSYEIVVRKLRATAQSVRLEANYYGCYCRSIQYTTPRGSVGILEPSVSPNTIAVGAAHHSACAIASNTAFFCPDGKLLFYSSQGPTTDGRTKPEIAAPTHVSTVAFGPWTGNSFNGNVGFTGTSAATPHVAGAAALVIQALSRNGTRPTPAEVLKFLDERAEDLGPAGIDNKYGAGFLSLGQPPQLQQAQPPVITAINPSTGLQGSSVEAIITGTNLSGATAVTLSGEGVTAKINEGGTATSLPVTVIVAANAATGPREITVTTAAGAAQNSSVVFAVLQGPTLAADPASLNFTASINGQNPEPQRVSVINSGGGTLTWSAEANVPWLILTQTPSQSPDALSVAVVIKDLPEGTYDGEITISSKEALNSPVKVPVTLTIAPEQAAQGELIALVFKLIEFVNADDWERSAQEGCVVYTNISAGPSIIRVTLPDNSARQYAIPARQRILVCADVVHIDTRPPQE